MNAIRRYLIWAVIGLGVLMVVLAGIGWTMDAEHTVTRQAVFSRDAKEVWVELNRFDRWPQWRSAVDAVRIESGDPIRFVEIGDQGPLPMEVSEKEAPTRLVLKADDYSLPFTGTWTFVLEPTDTGTRLSITEHATIDNPLFRFVARVSSSEAETAETFLVDLGRHFGEEVVPLPPEG